MPETDYCLWLNGKKIYSAAEIKASFDLPSLRGYLLGGGLINWLKSHSGLDIAAHLNEADFSGVLDSEYINSQLEYAFGIRGSKTLKVESTDCHENNLIPCSFFNNSSFFTMQSFPYFNASWGSFGSFRSSGSISYSGSASSFKMGGWSSFNGSFSIGGSFIQCYNKKLSDKEIDEIRAVLEICPLNRYGYGIHLI